MRSSLSLFGVLFMACVTLAIAPTTSFAIGGCSSRPRPTANPDDTGCAGSCSGVVAQCRNQCRAANRCCRTANPPGSTTGCQGELGDLADCIALYPAIFDSGVDNKKLGRVVWSRNGCQLRHINPDVQATYGSSRHQTSADLEQCDEIVVSAVEQVTGVDLEGNGALAARASSRNLRALGVTRAEKQKIAATVGERYSVVVGPRVVRHMRSMDDMVNCVASAAESAR